MLEKPTQIGDTPDIHYHATLLIVDDHLDNVRSLALLLSDSGYLVRKATSGEMALETIQIAKPDLVLLDVRMPEMDGYEVCERIKANPNTCDVPIIFLSASNDTDDKIQAFEVGGADYVTKPFQAEEVLARVRHQVTILQQKQQLQQQQQQLALQNYQLRQEIKQREQLEAKLQQANLQLQHMANTDSLTQLANRRCFDAVLQQEWQRLKREQQPLSLILCDIDYFKQYNDLYGHPAGDVCLERVAQAIAGCVNRSADKVARYGGEEFAVILPNTDLAGAVSIVEAIRATLESLQIPHTGSVIAAHITLSLGIACLIPTSNSSCQELLAATDAALYRAKQQGRNTWRVAP
ncbi:GGDEF domain-containing response regulator [Leptolyngbya ohadii]|uniref:GGDEF domain-containing response regulator n=1 Tax=Leptolyngbya ohadii TaxID=1962290 RepID=UPI000B5A0ADD|nr:PleD family two-component system response regulator [Leptolyngbya ohadii]